MWTEDDRQLNNPIHGKLSSVRWNKETFQEEAEKLLVEKLDNIM